MDTRSCASSGSPFESTVGFSRAVRDGRHIAVSGTAPIWPDGHVSPDPGAQTRRCWEIALGALAELGGQPKDVVRTRHYITDRDIVDVVAQVHGEVFGDIRPASTMVVVAGLVDPRWLVEVELDAMISSPEGSAADAGTGAGSAAVSGAGQQEEAVAVGAAPLAD